MKFSINKFSIITLILSSFVFAQVDINLSKPEESIEGEYIDPSTNQPFLYEIECNVINKVGDFLEIYNGEEITLNYTFTNYEEEDASIVGVGGSFSNPLNGEILANITDSKIGPIKIITGETKFFTQRIHVNLPADNYILNPNLYVMKGPSLALLGTNTKLVTVSDLPISLFSPQLLLLEILLLATFFIGGYFIWINFGQSYFKSIKPIKPIKTSNGLSSTSNIESGKKIVDESWLPEGHKPKLTKRKVK